MITYFFKDYKQNPDTSFSLPHRYKFAQLNNNTSYLEDAELLWNRTGKQDVWKLLRQKLDTDYSNIPFYLVVPPTTSPRKEIFFDPIVIGIANRFPQSINLVDVFTKQNEDLHAATETNFELVSENIVMNVDQFRNQYNADVQHFLIFDDVYATGNTVNAIAQKLAQHTTPQAVISILTLIKT